MSEQKLALGDRLFELAEEMRQDIEFARLDIAREDTQYRRRV